MARIIRTSSILLLLCVVFCPASFSEPLNIRNLMPMYVFYMAMAPDRAQTLKKGRATLEAGYHVANVIITQHDLWISKPHDELTYWMIIDAEVNRFYADIRYGLSDRLEIGVNIPYYSYSSGYLDSFIENFEDLFSFIKTPNAREERGRNLYQIRLDHYGDKILDDDSEPDGLGEITLEAKYKLLEERGYWPTLSIRTALKLPTAYNDSSKLLGSDKVDYGLGVLADKKLLDGMVAYANFNLIFIGKPDILSKLDVDNYMLSGMLALEFLFRERTSMIFQAMANSAVYEDGVSAMDTPGIVLSLGLNHHFNDRLSWQIALDENTSNASPDFGIFTSFKLKL